MQVETPMVYWININRPEMQYKTNGVSRWYRKVGDKDWRFHEGLPLSLPSPYRYVVTEQELEDRPKE